MSTRFFTNEEQNKVIHPYIRGKDVQRWSFERGDRYIIYFPRGTRIEDYPAIEKHLSPYRERLEMRALDQQWYELQQAQVAFEKYFRRRKIVYPNVSFGLRFAIDAGSYMDMTTFAIDSEEIDWLIGILNSFTLNFFFLKLGIERRGGYQEFKTQYVSLLPIPEATPADRDRLSTLAEAASEATGTDLEVIETEINQIVYRLFDLTDEEINLIETSLAKKK